MRSVVSGGIPAFLIIAASFSFLMGCGDDKAREAATAEALNKAPAATGNPGDQNVAAGTTPATAGTLILSASKASAKKGETTCLAVRAKDFRGIVSMQYTMKWEPELLQFKEVKAFGLPGLGPSNFGTTQSSKGFITYSWFDANVQGITKADGETLYEVCFDVLGKAGSKAQLLFTNEPTVIEITNAASQFLDLQGQNGEVAIQ